MCSLHFDLPTVQLQRASVSKPRCSQAPLPVREASKLELPVCHSDAGTAARTRTSESGPARPSDPAGAGGAAGPAPDVLHQQLGDAAK
jgi:hypothetical protein